MLLEKAARILQQGVCDNCLGRQFAQLGHGFSNRQRGSLLRLLVAMSIDKEKGEIREEVRERAEESAQESAGRGGAPVVPDIHALEMSNFHGFEFHNLDEKAAKPKRCEICGNAFDKLESFAKGAIKKAKGYEFATFLVGTRISGALLDAEESLWERVGIDYVEPLKAELNREIGKLIEKRAQARFDAKQPDIAFLVSVPSGKASLSVNPLFVYGEYQKLRRGIPQTKWPSGKYRTSVEQIIAKPFMAKSKAKAHKLHGMGREDIDARCLAWRPFVLELLVPRKRWFDMKRLAKKILSAVRVRKLRASSIAEVRAIKEARPDKTYRAIVTTGSAIARSDLRKLKSLGAIVQRTPLRVAHRRADMHRKRKVKRLSAKLLGKRRFLLTVRCEAGLYVKELVAGDAGRTRPSVAELLGTACSVRQLDVVKIHRK